LSALEPRTSRLRLQHLLHSTIVRPWWRNDLGQFLAVDQHFDLVGVEHFALQERQSNSDQGVVVRTQNALRGFVSLAEQALHFIVNFDGSSFAVVAMLADFPAQEY